MKREQLERENRLATRIIYQKDRQFRENYYKMLDDIASMLGQKEKAEDVYLDQHTILICISPCVTFSF